MPWEMRKRGEVIWMDGNLNDLSANSFTKSKGAIKDESVNLRLGN